MEVKRQARRAAQQDTTVLLLGETGTGKEMLAHAIQRRPTARRRRSSRSTSRPSPTTLLEAEFFGAAPGAYTGADRQGTRRQVQDRRRRHAVPRRDRRHAAARCRPSCCACCRKRKSSRSAPTAMFKVDVRIIAATSVGPRSNGREGRFRADLYYRLNVLPIELPPLRERLSDLEALCESILEEIAAAPARPPARDHAARASPRWRQYDWPGNVRELRNVLERATMLIRQRADVGRRFPAYHADALRDPRRTAQSPASATYARGARPTSSGKGDSARRWRRSQRARSAGRERARTSRARRFYKKLARAAHGVSHGRTDVSNKETARIEARHPSGLRAVRALPMRLRRSRQRFVF